MKATLIRSALIGFALAGALSAQQLRLGVARSNFIVIARATAIQPLGDQVLHRFEVLERLKGEPAATFSIAVPKQVADVPAPELDPRPQLLCLRPASFDEVPERFLPIYRMTGYRGDHFHIADDAETEGRLEIIRALVESEDGVRPAETSDRLVEVLLQGEGAARLEAAETLRARQVLRDEISSVHGDQMLLLAVGEGEDLALKIAVAQLVIEADVDNAMPALCSAVHQNDSEDFAVAVGKLARSKLGEEAETAFDPWIERVRGAGRNRILIAIGATRTLGALTRLRREWSRTGRTDGLVKALRAHGSAEARALIESDDDGR